MLAVSGAVAMTASLLVAGWITAGSANAATITTSKLTMLNGWTDQAFGTAKATAVQEGSIVSLRGGISTTGTNPEAFVLPPTMRPPTAVYVNVDMCSSTQGRLFIQPSGEVDVQAVTFANAQCFTSLDGVTFGAHAGGFHALTLQNSWVGGAFGTAQPAVSINNGVVTLKGAVATDGLNAQILTLPAAYRPTTTVWLPADLCNAANGRLEIQPSGAVSVQAENSFSDAQCFTSLDGASFVKSGIGSTPLSLINNWTGGASGASAGAVEDEWGYVHLSGAINDAISGNDQPFVLAPNFRPSKPMFVAVDLCNATNGRLDISTDGTVSIEQEGGGDSNSTCFTSLDGVSFEANAYTKMVLMNGWQDYGGGTSVPAAAVANGIVTLAGAMSTAGTNPVPFTLPPGMRPTTEVYVPVDLCNATDGRLRIDPSGTVTVQDENPNFSDAQCFTSLDGASFSIQPATFHALTLINGWTNGPFGTNSAAVANINGVITLKGAISGGTTNNPFVLPAAYRPTSNVFVKVDLCNSTEGRLYIQSNGTVEIDAANNAFANAQCFTSLDGASFVKTGSNQQALTLLNSWTSSAFGTATPAVEDLAGQVHLSGAISTTGTNENAFVVPTQFAPGSTVYVPLALCGGNTGRLIVEPDGTAFVEDKDPTYAQAQCITALDGATYAR